MPEVTGSGRARTGPRQRRRRGNDKRMARSEVPDVLDPHAPLRLALGELACEPALELHDRGALVYPLMVGLAVGELTADGVDDVVVPVNFGPAQILASPTWQVEAEVPIGGSDQVNVDDADGDGVDDLWTPEACVYLAPLPAAGAVADGIRGHWSGAGVAHGDVDGDGTLDAALYEAPTASVFLGRWTGTGGAGDAFASVGPVTSGAASEPAMALVAGLTGALAVEMEHVDRRARAPCGSARSAGAARSTSTRARSFGCLWRQARWSPGTWTTTGPTSSSSATGAPRRRSRRVGRGFVSFAGGL